MITAVRISILALLIMASCLIVLATIYDVRTNYQRHQRRKRATNNPQYHGLSILVYAYNDQGSIEACLQSIIGSQLSRYDIVVVDMVSSDGTRKCVRSFQATHPDAPLRLYAKRIRCDRTSALREGYRRSKRYERCLVVDADTTVELTNETLVFEERVEPRRLLVATTSAPRLSALISYSITQSLVIYHKALWFWPWRYVTPSVSGYLYESSMLSRSPSIRLRYRYDDRSAVCINPISCRRVQARGIWHVVLRLLAASWLLLIMTVGMVLGAMMKEVDLLLVCWLLGTGWFLVVVWTDDRTDLKNKLTYSFGASALYFIWYAASIIAELYAVIQASSRSLTYAISRRVVTLLYVFH